MEMNLHMLNEMFDEFSKTLKEAGYESMLYASEYYLNNVWFNSPIYLNLVVPILDVWICSPFLL